MYTILVTEDDRELNQTLCYALDKEGYRPAGASSINEAKKLFRQTNPDLILLDVNLPDGEGFSFCKWAKEQKNVPVLFLTARDLEKDALLGYETGADDYVTKPFSIKVLLKKIALIFCRTMPESSLFFHDDYLSIDLERMKVTAGGAECPVTATEFRLLRQFLSHKNHLLTYEVLLERVWDADGLFVDKHTLAVNVNRLRGKIENDSHQYISNVYGMGYQWIGL